MNARERFINSLLFEDIDRPFRWEAHFFWSQTISRWHAEGLPGSIDSSNINTFFDMDPIGWIPVSGGWAGNPYCPMFEEQVLACEGENVIRIEHDGITKKRRADSFDGTAPQLLKFPVKCLRDFEGIQCRLDSESPERLPGNWSDLLVEYAHREYPLGMFVLGAFGFTRNLLGDERLMYATYDDPELLRAVMTHYTTFYKGYIDKVCDGVVPDFIMMWEDMCYVNGPLISPASYMEWMAPYMAEVIAHLKGYGVKCIIVDCDGNLNKMIPVYLECGANVFFPMEVQSGMDVVALRKLYGKRFSMIGGINKNMLALDEEAIRMELMSKVPYMLREGGYMSALDHGCPPNVSFGNYVFFTELLRTMSLT